MAAAADAIFTVGILAQCGTLLLALAVRRYMRSTTGWWLMVVALALMVMRRVTAVRVWSAGEPRDLVQYLDAAVLPSAISVLFAAGLATHLVSKIRRGDFDA